MINLHRTRTTNGWLRVVFRGILQLQEATLALGKETEQFTKRPPHRGSRLSERSHKSYERRFRRSGPTAFGGL